MNNSDYDSIYEYNSDDEYVYDVDYDADYDPEDDNNDDFDYDYYDHYDDYDKFYDYELSFFIYNKDDDDVKRKINHINMNNHLYTDEVYFPEEDVSNSLFNPACCRNLYLDLANGVFD